MKFPKSALWFAGGIVLTALVGAVAAQTNYLGVVFIADSTTPANQMKVNADGSINTTASGGAGATTPAAGAAFAIATGGTAVTLVAGPVNGCYVVNPLSATDQGIAAAEVAYINPVGAATTTANGNTAALQPGQTWRCVPGQTTNVSSNAATSAHKLTVVKW